MLAFSFTEDYRKEDLPPVVRGGGPLQAAQLIAKLDTAAFRESSNVEIRDTSEIYWENPANIVLTQQPGETVKSRRQRLTDTLARFALRLRKRNTAFARELATMTAKFATKEDILKTRDDLLITEEWEKDLSTEEIVGLLSAAEAELTYGSSASPGLVDDYLRRSFLRAETIRSLEQAPDTPIEGQVYVHGYWRRNIEADGLIVNRGDSTVVAKPYVWVSGYWRRTAGASGGGGSTRGARQ